MSDNKKLAARLRDPEAYADACDEAADLLDKLARMEAYNEASEEVQGFIVDVLEHLEKAGVDTTDWDGDDSAACILAQGIAGRINDMRDAADKAEAAYAEAWNYILNVHGHYMAMDHGEPVENLLEYIRNTKIERRDSAKNYVHKAEVEKVQAEADEAWKECERLRELVPTTAQAMVYMSLLRKYEKLRATLRSIANCNSKDMTLSGFTSHASLVELMKRSAQQVLDETADPEQGPRSDLPGTKAESAS